MTSKVFENITVYPIINNMCPSIGGPQWPSYNNEEQGIVSNPIDHFERAFRGNSPDDAKVHKKDQSGLDIKENSFNTLSGSWIWGGFLVNHIGHLIADWFPRVVNSIHLGHGIDSVSGIIFSSQVNINSQYLDILHQLCHYLDISRDKVLVNDMPFKVEKLIVFPQGEARMRREPPSQQYLRFLELCQSRLLIKSNKQYFRKIYLSKSRWYRGKILGSQLIERMLSRNGYKIFYPGECDNMELLGALSCAQKIIIEEGSAVHWLQLIHNPTAEVMVLGRLFRNHSGIEFPAKYHVDVNKFKYQTTVNTQVHFHEKRNDAAACSIIDLKLLAEHLNAFDSDLIFDNQEFSRYHFMALEDVNKLSAKSQFVEFTNPERLDAYVFSEVIEK